MRKQFATSIDEGIQVDFKNKCLEYGVAMNVILEAFMKEFSNGDFELKLTKSSFTFEEKK